jgi:hypothetical protein
MLYKNPLRNLKKARAEKHSAVLRATLIRDHKALDVDAREVTTKASCWKPWHEHMLTAVEILTPPDYGNVYLLPSADWTGKKIVISIGHGPSVDELNPFVGGSEYLARQDFDAKSSAIADTSKVLWMQHEMDLTSE